jgi:hypothetical protein
VELMQVIEEFIHIVGLGMKDFHNAYLMTGNLGKNHRQIYSHSPQVWDGSPTALFLSTTQPPSWVKITIIKSMFNDQSSMCE